MILIDETSKPVQRGCRGCGNPSATTAELLGRLLSRIKAEDSVSDELYAHRLQACRQCGSLAGEATCMHCGCYVEVRAKFKVKGCPHPEQAISRNWESISIGRQI